MWSKLFIYLCIHLGLRATLLTEQRLCMSLVSSQLGGVASGGWGWTMGSGLADKVHTGGSGSEGLRHQKHLGILNVILNSRDYCHLCSLLTPFVTSHALLALVLVLGKNLELLTLLWWQKVADNWILTKNLQIWEQLQMIILCRIITISSYHIIIITTTHCVSLERHPAEGGISRLPSAWEDEKFVPISTDCDSLKMPCRVLL